MSETNFARWRRHVGITQREAAGRLHLSLSRITDFETGIHRTSGKPAVPDYATRVLMRLLAEDKSPNPWPE